MISYFVSYSYTTSDGSNGNGCIDITRHSPIICFDDINSIADFIATELKNNGLIEPSCVVQYWTRYEKAPLTKDNKARVLEALDVALDCIHEEVFSGAVKEITKAKKRLLKL
jgi:hypothetical protein